MSVRYALMSVTVVRGGLEESRHQVHVAVAGADGELVAWHGDPQRLTTLRSAAKPFQAEPLVASGALEAFGFDDETLAVCCASHAGTDAHVAAVRRGLDAAGVDAERLRNTTGSVERRLRHDCSGNHLALPRPVRPPGMEAGWLLGALAPIAAGGAGLGRRGRGHGRR